MAVSIFGFLDNHNKKYNSYSEINFIKNNTLNLYKPNNNRYPVLKIFNQIDKNSLSQIIVFNTSNEIAVDLFINNKIKFIEIPKFINKSLNKFDNFKISNINEVIQYQNYVYSKLII